MANPFLINLRHADRSALTRLRRALRASGGNLRDAAAALGVSARQLSRVGTQSEATGAVLRKHGMGRSGAAKRATAERVAKRENASNGGAEAKSTKE